MITWWRYGKHLGREREVPEGSMTLIGHHMYWSYLEALPPSNEPEIIDNHPYAGLSWAEVRELEKQK